jgi:hypothetical protein
MACGVSTAQFSLFSDFKTRGSSTVTLASAVIDGKQYSRNRCLGLIIDVQVFLLHECGHSVRFSISVTV